MTNYTMAEESVIGCILVYPKETFHLIRGIVTAGDFAGENARAIFRAAVDLEDNRLPIDPVTLAERAEAMGYPVSQAWLKDVMAAAVTTANAAYNAELVHRAAIEREAKAVCQDVLDNRIDPEDAAARLHDVLRGSRATIPTPAEDGVAFYEAICKAAEGKQNTVLPTGFGELDSVLGGGLVIGGLITMAARTSVGKSLVALAIAGNVSRRGGRVLYISLEMKRNQLWSRRVAARTGISSSKILNGQLPDKAAWEKVARATSELHDEPLMIWDKPCRITDIERLARAAAPLDLIVIDYLNNIMPEKGEETNFYVSASNTCRRLQALASAIETPILMLSQMNRGSVSRDDKAPKAHDIRDSGKVEELSDVVLLLNRPSCDRKPWEHQIMTVDVAKNRNGMTGKVDLDVVLMTSSVRDMNRKIQPTSEPTPFEV